MTGYQRTSCGSFVQIIRASTGFCALLKFWEFVQIVKTKIESGETVHFTEGKASAPEVRAQVTARGADREQTCLFFVVGVF